MTVTGRFKDVICPRCRVAHIAGAEPDDDRMWFTCGPMRYEIPDEWGRLGTPEAAKVGRMRRRFETGCLRCGQTVACTDKDAGDGATRWICYHCWGRPGGTVGWYVATLRDNYDPADDLDPAELLFDRDGPDLTADGNDDPLGEPSDLVDWVTAQLEANRAAGEQRNVTIPAGSTRRPAAADPDDIEGRGLIARIRRADRRVLRWMQGDG